MYETKTGDKKAGLFPLHPKPAIENEIVKPPKVEPPVIKKPEEPKLAEKVCI